MFCTEINDFNPEGYSDWLEEQSKERQEEADRKIQEIISTVTSYVFSKFKEKYGKKNYFDKGVKDKKINSDAYSTSLDYLPEERLPLENYIDFIDFKKIIGKEHWQIFEPVFNIPERGEKGRAKNLKWIDYINKCRRVYAHRTEDRLYKLEDFEYIDWIYNEFTTRIKNAESSENNNVK